MNYFGIEPVECNNGFGFGTTLFVAGCEHHCRECFNKKTWNRYGGGPFTKDTMRYLLKTLANPNITRLTISGGDPLSVYNRMSVIEICKEVKKAFPSIDIWIYTGYTLNELTEQSPNFIQELCNVANHLVDGKFDSQFSPKPFRGSGNQKVYDLKTKEEVLS